MKPDLRLSFRVYFFGLWLLIPGVVIAQKTGVSVTLHADRIELKDGAAVSNPVTSVKPGDVVEYSSVYRNDSNAAVQQLRAVIPIPVGSTYQAGSAVPAGAQASLNGVDFEPIPIQRNVRQPDGSDRLMPVPLTDYRALRWTLPTLPPAQNSTARLRVRIDTAVTAVAAKP